MPVSDQKRIAGDKRFRIRSGVMMFYLAMTVAMFKASFEAFFQ